MKYNPKMLRTIWLKFDYSQKYLASHLNISVSQYCKIENGDKALSLEILLSISNIYRVNPCSMLETLLNSNYNLDKSLRSEQPKAEDKSEIEFLKKLVDVTEQKYQNLYSLISRSNDNLNASSL